MKSFLRNLKKTDGFTLTEIIIALGISSIVSFQAFNTISSTSELDSKTRSQFVFSDVFSFLKSDLNDKEFLAFNTALNAELNACKADVKNCKKNNRFKLIPLQLYKQKDKSRVKITGNFKRNGSPDTKVTSAFQISATAQAICLNVATGVNASCQNGTAPEAILYRVQLLENEKNRMVLRREVIAVEEVNNRKMQKIADLNCGIRNNYPVYVKSITNGRLNCDFNEHTNSPYVAANFTGPQGVKGDDTKGPPGQNGYNNCHVDRPAMAGGIIDVRRRSTPICQP